MSGKGFKRHFTLKMFTLEHDEPKRFVHGPWRRKPEVSALFLAYRIILPLILLGVVIWSMTVSWNNGKWFIYLTNWGFMLVCLQSIVGGILVARAHRNQRTITDECSTLDLTGSEEMPISYKLYWLMYNMAIPVAIFITILYWSMLYDASKEKSDVELDFFMHAGNAVAAFLELMIGGPPSRFLHALQPTIFGCIYLIFNVVYWAAGGTDPNGEPWIYPVLNWNKPESAAILVVGCTVLLIILHLAVTILAGIRSRLAKRVRGPTAHSSIWNTPPSISTGNYNKAFVIDVSY